MDGMGSLSHNPWNAIPVSPSVSEASLGHGIVHRARSSVFHFFFF